MSKSTPEIAKAILERRNRMTHVIMPGEISAEIGPDGVAEALQRRWVVPDTDDGYLCANNDLHVVAEMRKVAEMKPEEFQAQAIPCAESHSFLALHAKRQHNLTEIAAPMTGQPSPGLAAAGQPAQPTAPVPAAPPKPVGAPGMDMPIGTAVTVARQGIKANGVIEKLMPDGKFQIGFPPETAQRPQGDNIYSKEELSVVPTAPKSVATGP